MRRALLVIFLWPLMGAANLTAPGAASPSIDISDVTDGKLASYKTTIWVVADSDIDAVTFVPSELKGKTGGQKIPPSAVHVNSDAPMTFKKGTSKAIAISIDVAQPADVYEGQLTLSGTSALEDTSKHIPVVLRLTAKPNVAPIPAAFSFKTVRCASNMSCAFAQWFLPKGQALGTLPWQLSNYSVGTVDWTPRGAVLRGEKSGEFIELEVKGAPDKDSEVATALPASLTLPLQKPTKLLFKVDRSTIGADHYQGQYRIEFKGSEPITVPFSLDVRSGPFLPLLVLVLGIVLGRLIQSTNTPRAQAQLRLMDQYQRVANVVDSVVAVTARNYLHLRLEQTSIDISKMAQPEGQLATQLDAILRLATDSNKLDSVEPKIQAVTDPAAKAALQQLLAQARSAILAADAATAEANLATIDTKLAAPPGAIQAAARRLVAPPNTVAPSSGNPNSLLRGLSWLSGSSPLDGSWYYSFGRPLMFLLLLILLAFVGLYNSYMKNATFGSEGYFDYLSLFLWGISADVAQKTLQNLTLARS